MRMHTVTLLVENFREISHPKSDQNKKKEKDEIDITSLK